MAVVKDFFSGIYNLIVGLFVTGKHLGRHAITLQYPKERWPMPERSRGVVVLLSDPESGDLNCTACLLCMKACPTAAILVEREKNPETKRWFPTKFVIDNTICCFCGLCEEACNFDAIKLTGKYEYSVYDQSELVYDMGRLAEMGRDVKYTPKEKKKPAAKPAAKPAPKPAAKSAEANNTAAKPAEKPEAKPKAEAASKTEEKPQPPAKEKAVEEKPKSTEKEKPVEEKPKKDQPEKKADKPENKEEKKPEEKKDQAELDLDTKNNKKDSGK